MDDYSHDRDHLPVPDFIYDDGIDPSPTYHGINPFGSDGSDYEHHDESEQFREALLNKEIEIQNLTKIVLTLQDYIATLESKQHQQDCAELFSHLSKIRGIYDKMGQNELRDTMKAFFTKWTALIDQNAKQSQNPRFNPKPAIQKANTPTPVSTSIANTIGNTLTTLFTRNPAPKPTPPPSVTSLATYDLQKVILIQRHIRKWLQEVKRKRQEKLKYEEIIITERQYVHDLELVIKVFLQPLKMKDFDRVAKHEIDLMFGNIEEVLTVNKQFLYELEDRFRKASKSNSKVYRSESSVHMDDKFSTPPPSFRIPLKNTGGSRSSDTLLALAKSDELPEWTVCPRIGNVFTRNASLLAVTYNKYAATCTFAFQQLAKLTKKSPSFNKWLNDRHVDPCLHNRKLSDFLIKPIQRVPHYNLLIHEVIKISRPNTIQYNELQAAYKCMHEVGQAMNELKVQAEHMEKILTLQDRITGDFKNLAVPGREFVREAHMILLSSNVPTSYHCYLFSDLLVYVSQPNRKWCGSVGLETATVEEQQLDGRKHGFSIKTPLQSYSFVCSSQDEKKVWMSDLKRLIKQLREKNQDVEQTLSEFSTGTPSTIETPKGPTKEGYLYRQSGLVKKWTKTWFVLEGGVLFFYNSSKPKESASIPKTIQLEKYTVSIMSAADAGRDFAFHLYSQQIQSYVLCANSMDELKQWVEAITPFTRLGKHSGIARRRTDNQTSVDLLRFSSDHSPNVILQANNSMSSPNMLLSPPTPILRKSNSGADSFGNYLSKSQEAPF